MTVSLILYLLYFSAAVFLFRKCAFSREAIPEKWLMTGLFGLQALAGIFSGWVFLHFSPTGSDYWHFHEESIRETEILTSDPLLFFRELLAPRYESGYGGVFSSTASFWNDFSSNLIIKFLSILNLVSGGNYYVNNLLLNIPAFFGHTALLRMFSRHYGRTDYFLLAGVFLIPSFLFFSSATHKDLFVCTGLSFFFYCLYMMLYEGITIRRIIILAVSLITVISVRNYLIILLVPAAVLLIINRKEKIRAGYAFVSTIIISLSLAFILQLMMPGKGPLNIIAKKRNDFMQGRIPNTSLPSIDLQPSIISFTENAGPALNHALLRPYPWETKNFFHLYGALELYFFIFLGIFQLLKRRKIKLSNWEAGLLVFSCLGIMLIGYIVPNYGSILRYRAIYYPFMLIPLLMRLSKRTVKHITL